MAVCTLCGGTSDDTDIINLTCTECFEIFGHAPNGDPADMSEKIVAAANTGNASRMTIQIDSELNSHNSTSCPSFGQFTLNNSTPASVTEIRFRDNNHNPASDFMNIRLLFVPFGKTGDYITFQDRDDNGTRTEIYKLTEDAEMEGNCILLTVEHIYDSGDPLLANEIARVFFSIDVDP